MTCIARLSARLLGVPRSQSDLPPEPPIVRCGSCERRDDGGCYLPQPGGTRRWVQVDPGDACRIAGGPGAVGRGR